MAMEAGADKVRINPGNIGSPDRVEAVLSKAKSCGIPIRIGVNSGSVEDRLLEKYGGVTADALVESALDAIDYARSFGFDNLVVSIKSSDIRMNYEAYTKMSAVSDVPLHVGLTEAGIGEDARRKSALGIGALLLAGIGDTIRVSLTGDPVQEVILAKKILSDVGIRRSGINFVSCPTCGRTQVDLPSIAEEVKSKLEPYSEKLERAGKSLTLAVMGCPVNGPGEAKSADLGVACGKGVGLIIKNGEILYKVKEEEICKALIRELQKMV
jgi:(E)-4-hydroxy-3-methylbut-2-enyl-diphosphate synthase